MAFEIIGHKYIWESLKKMFESGRISQTFLFFGPEKVGKKTTALELMKFINCKEGLDKRPCHNCRPCIDIQKRSYPDLFFVKPIGKEIKISQIRKLNWYLSLQPSLSSFKSAIIDKAHLMNQEAQNSLLKTLEEPKGKAVIVLVTSFPELLFPTIASRTKKIRFSTVAKEEIVNFLKKKKLNNKEIEEVYSASFGKPGEAIDILSDSSKIKETKRIIKELKILLDSSLVFRFDYAKKISEDREKLIELLDIWTQFFRKDLILSNFKSDKLRKTKKIINLLQDVRLLLLKTEVNPKLAIERILLEF